MIRRLCLAGFCIVAALGLYSLSRPGPNSVRAPKGATRPNAGSAQAFSAVPSPETRAETTKPSDLLPTPNLARPQASQTATPAVVPPLALQSERLGEYTNLPPDIVMSTLRAAFRLYGSTFNGNPVGTNPEITRMLNGGNPKHANFIRPEAGMRINGNGELVDPWGTPYFFHQLSAREMEIHSAGPDGIMWTADDLVTK